MTCFLLPQQLLTDWAEILWCGAQRRAGALHQLLACHVFRYSIIGNSGSQPTSLLGHSAGSHPLLTNNPGQASSTRVAVISAKKHKHQRRKRQSVTSKREKSQTPKYKTAIQTSPNLT